MRFDGSVGIVWNPPVLSVGTLMKDAFCCAMLSVDDFGRRLDANSVFVFSQLIARTEQNSRRGVVV